MLGTERHHRRYLRDVGALMVPGCFAMSELGHGSNVRDIRTVARFDPATDEFVVTTPDDSARKEWIGNAARHGRLAVVFAQLEVSAGPCGVHAFLVPIRDERGAPMPGVRLADDGEKEGLNGVDNGRIWFHDVRVPRDNLLDRYGSVSADGTYSSPIASASRRFFTMLGTLVGGRISVAKGALAASKSGLAIAIRYGAMRRQFGPSGETEVPILDYLTHQRRLMPPLATAYALDAALKDLGTRYAAQAGAEPGDGRLELETLAAGLKAYTTWHTVSTLQTCRECCGGQGYLAVNRIAPLKADLDVFTTFEGDNTVLMNLVAKGLLTDYRQQFGELRFSSMLRFLGRRAGAALQQLNPVVTRTTDEGHLRSIDFQLGVFQYREDRLLASAARRLKQRIDDGQDSFDAFNDCQDHLMELAHAHVERVVLERFDETISAAEGGARAALSPLRDLFALGAIERDAGWFQAANVLEGKKAEAVRAAVNRLVHDVRGMAPGLVEAFGIPDALLAAPIAFTALPESVP
jgi:acyl-CoA oxidase